MFSTTSSLYPPIPLPPVAYPPGLKEYITIAINDVSISNVLIQEALCGVMGFSHAARWSTPSAPPLEGEAVASAVGTVPAPSSEIPRVRCRVLKKLVWNENHLHTSYICITCHHRYSVNGNLVDGEPLPLEE